MVRGTLLKPQQVFPGRGIGRLLIEFFVEHKDFIEVITTYLTTKIEKYWKSES